MQRLGLTALAGTRVFQQAALFVAGVVVAGSLLLWLVLQQTGSAVSRQVIETLTIEAESIAVIAELAGPSATVDAVVRRARTGSDRLYLLVSTSGTRLAGNLDDWPAGMPRPPALVGATAGDTFDYTPPSGASNEARRRLAAGLARTLPTSMILLVGRDLEDQRNLVGQVRWYYLGGFGALALAGLLAGLLASRRTLDRIRQIADTSDQITTGDLSRRVRLDGSGDELDRLATNLNAMLDRIESLMAGLREVSDNIAHDLKTPLTRLRARAESALREGGQERIRDGLGAVIEEADELIKTFNALLLIARLEAGALDATAETFQLAPLVHDVAELYEPVAEEAGLSLSCRTSGAVAIHANRQLIGQAIANLIDNAIKYGRHQDAAGGQPVRATIEVTLDSADGAAAIAVADHGPGIPAVDRERVLKRFVRLEASRTRPGTGLGLSLVAAVARLHDGSITLADNAPGLKVELQLPLAGGLEQRTA
jgi:signal transduction histidine kinase